MTEWQPVPGAAGAVWIGLTSRPSIKNSNAFLLRAGRDLVVVDPGADIAQVARVNDLVADATGIRRVFALLSHCHYDHCGGFDLLRFPSGAVVHRVIHHVGAHAIESGDRELTVAYVWPEARLPDVRFDARLFGNTPLPFAIEADWPNPDGAGLPRLGIPLDEGHWLEVLHTPGHSPCSVSLRLGGLLIAGDVVLAPAPGLAGLAGWDQTALMRSLDGIARLIEGGDIVLCGQGHGPVVPAEAMQRALPRAIGSAAALAGVTRMDDARLRGLKAHALDLLEEADHLLAAMVDAVQLVASNLVLLEEDEAAAGLQEALDAASIKEVLGGLRRFAADFREGSDPDLGLVMKAAETAARVARLLRDRRTGEALRATLARRAETVLDDFMACAAGHSLPDTAEPTALVALAVEALEGFQAAKPDAKAYMDAAEDPGAFRQLLIRQLAWAGVARNMVVRVEAAGTATAPVQVARERLAEVLVALAEALALRERQGLVFRVDADGAEPRITVEGDPPIDGAELPPSRLALLSRLLRGEPGGLMMDEDGNRVVIRLRGSGQIRPPMAGNAQAQ